MHFSVRMFGMVDLARDLPAVCVGSSIYRSFICLLVAALLTVISGYDRKPLIPRFRKVITNVTCEEGDIAVLYCGVENIGTKHVTWRKIPYITPILIGPENFAADSRYSSINVPHLDQWNLEIRNVQLMDNGIYECQVSTTPHKMRQNSSLTVIERQYKQGMENSNDHEVRAINITGQDIIDRGRHIFLICKVTEEYNAPDRISWFLEGNKLETNKSRQLYISEQMDSRSSRTLISTLHVKHASMSDAGTYACRSSSGMRARFTVDVLDGCRSCFSTPVMTGNIEVASSNNNQKRDTETTRNDTVSRNIHGAAVFLHSTSGVVICVLLIQTIVQKWQLGE